MADNYLEKQYEAYEARKGVSPKTLWVCYVNKRKWIIFAVIFKQQQSNEF